MIDRKGFRLNVGIILLGENQQLFWGKRIGFNDAWQFPQGGLKNYETIEEAMYRELTEEVGLRPEHVKILAVTRKWLYYRLPKHLHRDSKPLCIGQKQKWFLLKLTADETHIHLDQSDSPEFDRYCWVDYWFPIEKVISFKRQVYRKALQEFAPLVFEQGISEVANNQQSQE